MPKNSLPIPEKISKWIGSPASLYIHTVIFILFFVLIIWGYSAEKLLLILTTLVSLEAIYLSILIQMSVNKNTESLEDVEESLEDVGESLEDVEEGLDEISEDIDEIQDDIEEIEQGENEPSGTEVKLKQIEQMLHNLVQEIRDSKKQ